MMVTAFEVYAVKYESTNARRSDDHVISKDKEE